MIRTLHTLFALRDLRTSPVVVVQTIIAARIAILYARAGRDYLPDMAVRLRSMRAAQALQAVLETANAVWPEPLLVHRPCCTMMTPDEALVADITLAAMRGSRGHAMEAMRDLLPSLPRDRLFGEMIELVDAIRAVQADPANRGKTPE